MGRVYRQYGFEDKLSDGFFHQTARELVFALEKSTVPCRVVF
jgi:hypothetical protein